VTVEIPTPLQRNPHFLGDRHKPVADHLIQIGFRSALINESSRGDCQDRLQLPTRLAE